MATPRQARPAWYRVSQFLTAVKAGLPGWAGGGSKDLTEANALLDTILVTAAQQELFRRMPANDRCHALAVTHTLQQAGYDQRALLQAALLHDVGKSIGQPLVHRVAIVLLQVFWPGALRRLEAPTTVAPPSLAPNPLPPDILDDVARWRRPFVVHARHPRIGAAWARAAGCEPLAVALIARHQDTIRDEAGGDEAELLALLQWADNLN